MKFVFFHHRSGWFWRILLALVLVLPQSGRTADRQFVTGHVPSATTKLTPNGFLDPARRLQLAIGLPPRNQAALDQLLRDLYNPAGPNFHHYLTPAQFAEKFGPDQADYQKVEAFAVAHHLTVTARHPNRVILDVQGTVADIEAAFHIRLRTYQHPSEPRQFFAPSAEPSLDLAAPILHISGLDDYLLPHPKLVRKPDVANAGPKTAPQTGSGPSGAFGGGDFRAAYVPGTALTGTGQSVGLLQFDGFYTADIASYRTRFNLPSIPLVVVPIDGGVSVPGDGDSEVSLDIEMVNSMAPGISTIYVYEAPNPSPWEDLLSRMANDNLSKQLSCSWGGGDPDPTAELIFQQMAAQGQSFFDASGDSDAFTGQIPFPGDSPNITQVGGTTLTTTGPGGSYVSETVWNWGGGTGSSGGISTYYSIPLWQQGISMAANQGSTAMRNVPDVALTGDNVYVAYDNGGSGTFGGTSCAAPLWAAYTALVNQQAAAESVPSVGFLNPAIYGLGSNFNDVTTGNNFSPSSPTRFSATVGYDLCTGLGTPGNALISAQLGAAPSNLTYSVNPATYTIGFAVLPNVPSSLGGRVSTYSVSPALPAGLVLDPATGIISGTPTAIASTANYTVTATNTGGSASVVLNITVNPLTPPTNLSYATNPAVYPLASPISPNIPSNQGGPVAAYSISPALSAGLTIDPATGIISGTPTSLAATTIYTVTASNDAGSTTATINLTVSVGSAVSKLFVALQEDGAVGEFDPSTGAVINDAFISGFGSPAGLALSGQNLFVADQVGDVGEYSASTGAAINANFITGLLDPNGLALSGNTLYVADFEAAVIGAYDASTGAAINSSLVAGLVAPQGVAVAGNVLFVADYENDAVGAYDATTGTAINAEFITGSGGPAGVLVSGNTLYVANYDSEVVSTYNATTGAVINANFVTGPIGPIALALAGNTLFVSDYDGGVVGAYDATTGAAINAGLITGLDGPEDLAVASVTDPPSGLTYAVNPAVYTLGLSINPNLPAFSGGSPSAFSVSPALPAGLALDPVSGVISGTPTVSAPAGAYTITAANPLGSTATTLSITVNDVPPSSLTYSTNPVTYALGTPINNNVPSSAGSPILSYSVTPPLPAGLVLNSTTGVVSGTPTAISPAGNYTVTATNDAGSAIVVLNITVADEAPSNLTYSANPVIYAIGAPITDNVPSSAGSPVQSYSVAPALPGGLVFDTATGIVSGTPTAVSPAANYTVTATNGAGSTTVELNITVSVIGNLFISSQTGGTIGVYNGSSGAPINASFLTGLSYPMGLALSGNNLFVVGQFGYVSEYNATTGAVINSLFINGLDDPTDLAISGNALFVTNYESSTVGKYDAATGAAINANFITGLAGPAAVAISGNNLFVANFDGNTVGKYDATTGALLSYMTGFNGPQGLTIVGNTLYVTNFYGNTVGEYNVATGAVINPSFISGLNGASGLASSGNSLFVTNWPNGPIGEYDLTTGAPINSSFITSVSTPVGIVVSIPVTTPPSGLTYSTNPAVYTLGLPITPNTPSSSGGAVSSYSVTPALPAGLLLDPVSGIISGTPVAPVTAGSYTITAGNSLGSTTAALNITVNDVAPSNLTYSTNPAIYTLAAPIVNNVPSSAGSPALSYSVLPALPSGLVLNVTTGVISGTPTALSAAANYTVTATNNVGSATVAVNIAVIPGSAAAQLFVANQGGASVGEYNSVTGATISASFITGLAYPSGVAILGPNLLVSNQAGNNIGEYNATTGGAINANFITGLNDPNGLLISGNNLFVANTQAGTVAEYNAATGALINAGFITGLNGPYLLAISGNTLFVSCEQGDTVGAFNATTGVAINASFISGVNGPSGLAVLGNTLFVASNSNTVAEYNATTGALINASFISGLNSPVGVAIAGNTLYVGNWGGGSIGEYNVTTGAAINASFITGLANPEQLAVVAITAAPSNLTYALNPAVYAVGIPIAPNTPSSSGGSVAIYSVSPPLPSGLTLDPATGAITGTPTAPAASAGYTVTASNSLGSATATLNITVIDEPPTSLAYSANPAVYALGNPVTPDVPSSAGSPVLSYSILPSLPAGLVFNAATGVISGTPTAASAASNYTVTATNDAGSATVLLNLAVIDVAPSALVYSTNPAIYTVNVPIPNNIPSSAGSPVLSYSVTPALPAGLSLNPTTGVISGTPTALSVAATYTVTATNNGGSTSAGVNIAVTASSPQLLVGEYFGLGEYNSSTGAPTNANFITGITYADGIAISGNNLFVTNPTVNCVAEYNASTGALVNANFISTGLTYPWGLAISGNTLFVANAHGNTIGAYDASTGAAINASFITGLSSPENMVVIGNTLFVTNYANYTVGAYNASTGAVINANFISGLFTPTGLASAGNTLYVASATSNVVGTYNASTGAAINSSFISGLSDPQGLAIYGNVLYVANEGSELVSTYNASSGALINAGFVTGLDQAWSLAVVQLAAMPPSGLTYAANPAVYTLGLPIIPNTPNSTGGAITSYSVSPNLPTGLSLDPSSGIISGTPISVASAANYTVTASNSFGSTTASVNIAVLDVAPSNLTYSANPAVYSVGNPIVNNIPSSSGSPIFSYSVTPSLPTGLTLNTTTGVISGTPSALSASANYTVTGTNNAGSAAVVLNITVSNVTATAALYIARGSTGVVGEYNSATGAAINANFIMGLSYPNNVALSGNNLFTVCNGSGTVGKYDATTGATINGGFITGLSSAVGLALSGNNLYVSSAGSNVVGEYNATTGALINGGFISGLGSPHGLAVSGNDLFVANYSAGSVGEYNATTGATISANFITGLSSPEFIAVSNGVIYVVNSSGNSVGAYSATTGAAINANLVSGLSQPIGVAVSGNSLFISSFNNGVVWEYNATTGAQINTSFITGVNGVLGLAVAAPALAPPANLTYATNPAVYTLGLPITPNTPSSTGGAVASYSVSPPLPAGLGMDPASGIISGTPTVSASASSYTVTASNSSGSTTAMLNITVNDVSPSNLTYSSNPAGYTLGQTIANNVPTSAGSPVLSYSVTPDLPAGLSLNTATGVISGTPTALAPAANYTVAAFNGGGSTTVILNLTVNPVGGHDRLFVGAAGNGVVGLYDAVTGAAINATFVNLHGAPVTGLLLSGNKLFVLAHGVGVYDANTGAPINASLVSGLDYSTDIAISGNTLLIGNQSTNSVDEYNATSGAVIKTGFVTGLERPWGIAISGNNLYVANADSSTVGEYNAVTGAAINSSFINGLIDPVGLAISNGDLLVVNAGYNVVGEYNPSTGAAFNGNFITNQLTPVGIAVLGNSIYIANSGFSTTDGTVSAFDATTGAAINANLVTGLNDPLAVAVQPGVIPPFALAYSTNPAVYTKGSSITSNVPSSSGDPVASYSVSPALPAGLALDPSSGFITGAPTAVAAAANYTITATNAGGSTAVALNITVNDVPPSALTYAVNPAIYMKGSAITANNPHNNGGTVVSYSVSPALPAGLGLNTSTGVISGTPMVLAPSANYTITATNSGGSTTVALNITVVDVPPSSLTYSANPASYTKGMAIAANNPSNGGGLVVSYSVSPALPIGLALNTSTGVISGTPTGLAAAANYTITARNSGGTATVALNLTVNDVPPSSLAYSANPGIYTKGTAIAANNPSSSGGPVVSYSVSPALPAGLALNTSTGVITGTPTGLAVAASYTVTATNSGGSTTAMVNLTVNDVPPSALAYSSNPAVYTKGTAIAANNPSNAGGAVVSYSVSPPLPAGLTLNASTGIVSGTPTTIAPAANYTVTATNTGGSTTTKLNVTVNDLPPSLLNYSANPAAYTKGVPILANNPSNSEGVVVSYSVSPPLPSGLALNTTTGVVTGTPLVLAGAQNYTVTATNSGGSTTVAVNITVNDVPPASLTYSMAPAIYTKGTAILANNPSNNGGPVVSYSVSPALPAGLTLSTSTGVITGNPTAVVAAATYTITATNTGGSTTFGLNLTVNDVAPAGLTYSTNPAVYTKGTAIAANNPASSGGAVVSYSVSPELPAGLTLNTSTGVISGTPAALASSANYTITALNSGGSTIATLNLTVNDVAPTGLAYSANPAVFTKGVAILNDAPSHTGGTVVSYTVSPPLPAGLAFDSGTGVISGTPTVLSASANYTVTATNTGGSTTAMLNLTVDDVAPSALAYSANPASYRIGAAITTNRPSNGGGPVLSYSVSPALPAGLTLNPSTGVVSGTPTTITAEANYTITATNTGGSTIVGLDLTILDALPVAASQTLQATTHEPLSITLSATEVIPETTTYAVVTPPHNGALNGSGASLQYMSNETFAGTDSFTFQATDNGGTSVPATITINVSPAVSKQGYYYGKYVGLISGPDAAHSGTITIMSPGTGNFTASLKYGGVAHPLKGNFINSKNRFQTRLAQKNAAAIPVELDFGVPDGPDLVTGNVGDSMVIANNAVYSAKAPAPEAGRYTVKIPSDPAQTDGSTTPQGYGVGALVVSKAGSIRYTGTLADGTNFSQGTLLTRNGVWYVFLPLYAAKGPLAGMLEGTVQFENTPEVSDLDGAVVWTKPALAKQPYPKGALYPLGFDLATSLFGSAFNPKGSMVVTPNSAGNTFLAEHGNLAGGQMTEAATATKAASGLKITGAGNLSLNLAKSTGLVHGGFKEPGAKATSPVNAVIFQKGSEAAIIGNFRDYPSSGANQSGTITVTSP